MTKKLEEILNLPEAKDMIAQAETEEKNKVTEKQKQKNKVTKKLADIDKISAALPAVKGLGELADNELNEVADKSMAAYEDLMDLGMNVEQRYSARLFEIAGQMLKTNLDAKNAKLDKKLKMIELQLRKEKQDKDASGPDKKTINGEGYVVTDRNSLLDRLKNLDKDK